MNTKLVTWVRQVSPGALLGLWVLFSAGCTVHEGVAYSGGPYGGAYYDYYYYPEGNVYFYPQGHTYYWHDGGHWRSGRSLPPHYAVHEEKREYLHLPSRQPWTVHNPGHQGEYGQYGRGHDHD